MNKAKSFYRSAKELANKKYAQAGALAVTGLVTAQSASAASLLPTGVFTDTLTTATDTITDVMLYLVPVAIGVSLGKAVLGWSKGGTKQALR